jgi:hypothetical protein
MNPFLVLDLPPDATDGQVRGAYQKLLRRFPPEHKPREFQLIQEAYQATRTAPDRLRWLLLHVPQERDGPLEAMEAFAQLPGRMKPPGAAAFRSLLRGCANAALRDQTK